MDFEVIEGKSWLEANQTILKRCKTPYFLRVDDDMLVQEHAIPFMWNCIDGQSPRIALRQWELWEPYNNRTVRGIKIYTTKIAQKIGYRVNHLGKIDKPFRADCDAKGYSIESQKDIVGVHSCSDNEEEHVRYAKMRGEHHGKDFKKKEKAMRKAIRKCKLNLKQQLARTKGEHFLKLNRERHNEFYAYLHGLRN